MIFKHKKKYRAATRPSPWKTGLISCQSGGVLLWLIFMLLLAAALCTGLLYLSDSSNIAKSNAYYKEKAYYLAQSGGMYAVSLVNEDLNNGNTTNITAIKSTKTYNLNTSEQFSLEIDDSGSDTVLIKSTGIANPGTSIECRVQLTFQVEKSSSSVFNDAIFASNRLSMTSGATVDSYDSSEGSYNDSKDANSGSVATNSDTANINFKQVTIGGKTSEELAASDNVRYSQNKTLDTVDQPACDCSYPIYLGSWWIVNKFSALPREGESGNYEAGSICIQTRVAAEINEGIALKADYSFYLRDSSDLEINGDTVLCAGGNFTLENRSSLEVNGDVVFIVGGNFTLQNNSEITLTSDSTLTMYVVGNITIQNQSSLNENGTPANVMIYATGHSSTVTLQNNSKTFAAIYAPTADVYLKSGAELYGAVVGNNVTVSNGNTKIHYDKSLSGSSGSSSSSAGKVIEYFSNN